MRKLEILKQLVKKYPSDIEGHGYLPSFAENFPDTCRSMLEIGIANGLSADIWNEFYGDDVLDLHYIDLFINPEFVSPRWCRNRGFVPHIGSQADLSFLGTIKDLFSLILDDGSHVAYHMIVSFKALFFNNLLNGGIYIISDCHCNKEEYFWGEGIDTFEETPLGIFQNFLQTGNIESKFFNTGEREIFLSLIDWVKIEAADKLIIIKRKD